MAGFENAIRMLQSLTTDERRKQEQMRSIGTRAIPQTLAGIHQIQQANEAKSREAEQRQAMAGALAPPAPGLPDAAKGMIPGMSASDAFPAPDMSQLPANLQMAVAQLRQRGARDQAIGSRADAQLGMQRDQLGEQTRQFNEREKRLGAPKPPPVETTQPYINSLAQALFGRDAQEGETADSLKLAYQRQKDDAKTASAASEKEARAAKARKEEEDWDQVRAVYGIPDGVSKDLAWMWMQKQQAADRNSPEAIERERKMAEARARGQREGAPPIPRRDPVADAGRRGKMNAPIDAAKERLRFVQSGIKQLRATVAGMLKNAAPPEEVAPYEAEIRKLTGEVDQLIKTIGAGPEAPAPSSGMESLSVEDLMKIAGEGD